MNKKFFLIILILFLTGCTTIYEDRINEANSAVKIKKICEEAGMETSQYDYSKTLYCSPK
jgi:hypothetical protein